MTEAEVKVGQELSSDTESVQILLLNLTFLGSTKGRVVREGGVCMVGGKGQVSALC